MNVQLISSSCVEFERLLLGAFGAFGASERKLSQIVNP